MRSRAEHDGDSFGYGYRHSNRHTDGHGDLYRDPDAYLYAYGDGDRHGDEYRYSDLHSSPTSTATSTATATPTDTATATPSFTATATASPSMTFTPTATPTETSTPTPTPCTPDLRGRVDARYYFDPGISFVLEVTNASLNCDLDGPASERIVTLRAYATNDGVTILQWREVPVVVPPIPSGTTLSGRWNVDIPVGDPRTPLDQRELKFDMHAQWYVTWLEWQGAPISPVVWVVDTDYP